jgi:hypothetical protein
MHRVLVEEQIAGVCLEIIEEPVLIVIEPRPCARVVRAKPIHPLPTATEVDLLSPVIDPDLSFDTG